MSRLAFVYKIFSYIIFQLYRLIYNNIFIVRYFMNYLRKLYNWVLSWANHPLSPFILFIIAFVESSFFPIPPDVLLIPLCLSMPSKALFYALICTIGSTLGGILGYVIGKFLWEFVKEIFFTYIPGFTPEVFQEVCEMYNQYSVEIVFTAAFSPIPYKVITISAGVTSINFFSFVVTSLVGRGARFYLLAILIMMLGEKVKLFIEKYFEILTFLFSILIVLGFITLKFIFK